LKIKEDVSEWGEIELFECKISNIRETNEFPDQLGHIKKMFNKKNDMVEFAIIYSAIVNLSRNDVLMKNTGILTLIISTLLSVNCTKWVF